MRISNLLEFTRVIAISVAAVMLIITGFVQPALALRSATGPTDRAEKGGKGSSLLLTLIRMYISPP